LAIADVAEATSATRLTTAIKSSFNLLASMPEFGSKGHVTSCIINDGDSSSPTSWIDLEAQWLSLRVRDWMPKYDCKWDATKHCGFVMTQQDASPRWRARHQRLTIRIQDKDVRHKCLLHRIARMG
jgi:hypothetical protein